MQTMCQRTSQSDAFVGNTLIYATLRFIKIAVVYTQLMCLRMSHIYAVSSLEYVETCPLNYVDGFFVGVPSKLNPWVTSEFVGNTSNFIN